MQKLIIEFNYKLNDKECRIQCEPNMPIGDAKEFAYMFLKDIGQIEDQQKEQVEQAKAMEEAKKAEEASKKVEEIKTA
jgi:hypothetical protein